MVGCHPGSSPQVTDHVEEKEIEIDENELKKAMSTATFFFFDHFCTHRAAPNRPSDAP